MSEERCEGLNLTPPTEAYELYRHKNIENTATRRWSGVYWTRLSEAGDYKIRSVAREGEAHSMTGGVFPKEGFEEHYEKGSPS